MLRDGRLPRLKLLFALLLAAGLSAVGAVSAVPAAIAAAAKPPPGCTPTPLSAVAPSAAQLCVTHVLVTQDTDAREQNASVFTVTARGATLNATVPNWWPSGGPVAGMVVTLWGRLDATTGLFRVDRWIDHTHGSGPAPDGPYPLVSALDVASGRVPEHRMVWIASSVFLIDPQQPPAGNDGDIHVQTADGCPAAGVTTENTPPLRGYVDHPALPGLTSSTDTKDPPSNHLADAPPVGVPVMILGAVRYDYGFGWRELHPIRAWRFLTPAAARALAGQCASDPVPQLDRSGPLPVPFGVPPCTDGSEVGTPPGYQGCPSQCYVAKTVINQPEQLAGPCAGIKPIVTPDQRRRRERTAAASGPPPALGQRSLAATGQRSAGATIELAALGRVYGTTCAGLSAAPGAYAECLLAMARLAGSEAPTAAAACRNESIAAGLVGGSDFDRCVTAGRGLERRLAGARIVEG